MAVEGQPLQGIDHPLGHRTAFRYHPETRALPIESRPGGVSPVRLEALIRVRVQPHGGFVFSPLMAEGALDRLRNGTPKRVQFRVASPNDMSALEGDDALGIEDNLARLTNNFGGLTIEISVGFPRGHRDGILSLAAIRRAIPWATGNRDNVEKFEVKIAEEDDSINVFAEQMKIAADLDLDSVNVEANYEARRALLRQAFDDYLPVIRRLYG